MKASALIRRRVTLAEDSFAEIVIWKLPIREQIPRRIFKYRLAYVVSGVCVLRFDNERGKGDHRHIGDQQFPYFFSTPKRLLADFNAEIERWNHEHCRA